MLSWVQRCIFRRRSMLLSVSMKRSVLLTDPGAACARKQSKSAKRRTLIFSQKFEIQLLNRKLESKFLRLPVPPSAKDIFFAKASSVSYAKFSFFLHVSSALSCPKALKSLCSDLCSLFFVLCNLLYSNVLEATSFRFTVLALFSIPAMASCAFVDSR